jgi:hypothetical protein
MRWTCLLMICCASTCFAARRHPKHLPSPNHDAQIAQNRIADQLDLQRIQNNKELLALVRSGALVRIVPSEVLQVDPKLPQNRSYCRPWALHFIQSIAQQYSDAFGKPLMITSAVRTVRTQTRLLRINHNAAPAHGEEASSHLTGATIDIARKGMTREQNQWMNNTLLAYTVWYRVIFIEERVQSCYHIFVLPGRELPIL